MSLFLVSDKEGLRMRVYFEFGLKIENIEIPRRWALFTNFKFEDFLI